MRRLVIALAIGLVFDAAGLCAGAAELGYPGSALKEFERGPLPSFEEAPPLDAGSAEDAATPEPEKPPSYDEYLADCFVKIEGRVLISGRCQILREDDKSVTFELAGEPLVLSFRQSRTWTARLGERDLGKVYKRGSCWGNRGFYACDRGRARERR